VSSPVSIDTKVDTLAVAARFAAAPHDWPVAARFSPVERWFHRLATEPDHEVWLLTWLPGQGTDLHDHGGSAGALHVVSGELTEDTVGPAAAAGGGDRVTVRRLVEGIGRRFGPRHVHRIVNRSTRPAVSIHVYGPALTTMTRYRFTTAGLERVAIERAGAQW
jgi:predicted metal-dependent enzyme (double-stranded beta helix superfamily)